LGKVFARSQRSQPTALLVGAPEYIQEGSALDQAVSAQLKSELQWHLSETDQALLNAYSHYKLLPLHPWQARYLQSKTWFKNLKTKLKIIDFGEKGWAFSPTTSVRTMASFAAPWMLKPSLSCNDHQFNPSQSCQRMPPW
jgi:Siderophore synthetase component